MISNKIFLVLCIVNYCQTSSFVFPDRGRGKDGRPSKSLVFPEPSSSSGSKQIESGFRPSQAFDAPLTTDLPTTTSSIKDAAASAVSADQIARSPVQQSELTELDLVVAMERLVERLDTFELRLANMETGSVASELKQVNSELNSIKSLTQLKLELSDSIIKLAERNVELDSRLQVLEDFSRQRSNRNPLVPVVAIDENEEERSIAHENDDHCAEDFFSLNRTDLSSPCYHIDGKVDDRKSWQEAVTSCQKIGAKLAEPQSASEMKLLSSYLLTRSNQIGGSYWTGGINPGLLWLWAISGNPINNFPAELWFDSPQSSSEEENESNACLKSSYDAAQQRYVLKGSDCQRRLYFVCEYTVNQIKRRRSNDWLLKLLLQPPAGTTTTATPVVNYVGVVGFNTLNTTAHTGSNLTIF